MATTICVNTGSGNGLLPDGTKPLPEPMLTDHQWSPMTFILGQFHTRCLNRQSLKIRLKFSCLKFNLNFRGANELKLLLEYHDHDPIILQNQHIETETRWPPFGGWYLRMHFLEWNIWISNNISLEYVSWCRIENMSESAQMMAWCREG